MFQSRLDQFGALTWRQRFGVIIGLTVTIALALGLIVLSFSLAIILLPIVVVLILVARWRLRRAMAEVKRQVGEPGADRAPSNARIIDAEFEVVDDRQGREPPR
jgi:hypothetical protein